MPTTLHIAIPAMNEMSFLPRTLQAILSQKTDCQFNVYICVNQPDNWWDDAEKRCICEDNRRLLDYLKSVSGMNLTVLDYSSRGSGWQGKQYGVGWARKVLFDHILKIAAADDILISMDADTYIEESYFESIARNFKRHKKWHAISVPYYHPLTNDDTANRAILRYELYMRNFAINMLRIGSPYSFTAIGSAIATKIESLRKIGGITPMKSGEDFYLLQKLRKMGDVGTWNDQIVYPAARFSDRVFFGTGPAMIKGAAGDWNSYPIYHYHLFANIEDTYRQVDELYASDSVITPFISFLHTQFKQTDLFQPIRNNAKDSAQFARAFHEKADGLRILQFLKQEQNRENIPNEQSLFDNLTLFFKEENMGNIPSYLCPPYAISQLSTENLNEIRNLLFKIEMLMRKRIC